MRISYGPTLSSLQLALQYGFVVPGNPNDQLDAPLTTLLGCEGRIITVPSIMQLARWGSSMCVCYIAARLYQMSGSVMHAAKSLPACAYEGE